MIQWNMSFINMSLRYIHGHHPVHLVLTLVPSSKSCLLKVLDLPIELLYIDNSLLVVNKPPSVPVHPIGRYKVGSSHEDLHTTDTNQIH